MFLTVDPRCLVYVVPWSLSRSAPGPLGTQIHASPSCKMVWYSTILPAFLFEDLQNKRERKIMEKKRMDSEFLKKQEEGGKKKRKFKVFV